MPSLQEILDDVSDDQESDVNRDPCKLSEQPRISTLSMFVAMPNSDQPMNEGSEENMPEVEIFNTLAHHPSTPGKLPRLGPKKLAANLQQTRPRTAKVPRSNPQHGPQEPPAKRLKRGHRVGLNAQSHHHSSVLSLNREVFPLSQAHDTPPTAAEVTQQEQSPDHGLFMTPESTSRVPQSTPELQEQERRIEELFNEYGSDDDEDCNNEVNVSSDIHVPERLAEALKLAHDLDEAANNDSLTKEFDDINILKGFSLLKRTIGEWKSASDHSRTDESVNLSNDVLREAQTVLEKTGWDRARGLKHIYQRVLPSLVRMLYVSLVYHLSEVGTIEKLSYGPLKGCRNITKAIIKIAERSHPHNASEKFVRPQGAVGMIARIKNVHENLETNLRRIKLVKDAAENAQRQREPRGRQQATDLEAEANNARRRQTQRDRQHAAEFKREAEHAQRQRIYRERQRAAEREKANELKFRTWREHWRVLHDQRFGAELEGQFCLPTEKERHLRHIPLENARVYYPHWDQDTQVSALAEGLQKFTGPHVYRDIFRKYCCRGGSLQHYNVSEIVDKSVSLRDAFMKIAVEDGEDQEQWVIDIPDPRKSPV